MGLSGAGDGQAHGSGRGGGRSGDDGRRRGRLALRVGLAASVAFHAMLVAVVSVPGPEPGAGSSAPTVLREVELPPKVRVPPPPAPIRRPPAPQARRVDVRQPAGAADTPVPTPPSGPAPRPPEVSAVSPVDRPSLADTDVPPVMEAPDELRERLRRRYPDRLRDLGRGGVVELQFYVDETGEVKRVEVAESSGHPPLDRTAADITEEVSFLPALIRDRPVGIWVNQRICFVFVEEREDRPTPEECEQRVALGGG